MAVIQILKVYIFQFCLISLINVLFGFSSLVLLLLYYFNVFVGGRLEKHFTIEACPTYHNTNTEECAARYASIRQTVEARRKAHHALAARRTHQPSLEHRAYQLKVKVCYYNLLINSRLRSAYDTCARQV